MADLKQKELDAVDIFSGSLEALYGHQPITVASAGSVYEYLLRTASGLDTKLTFITPDTSPGNWTLHASDIWASARFLADHLSDLQLANNAEFGTRVLELGAGAGLPGIAIAKTYGEKVDVTVSDYPDDVLIKTLSSNVRRNGVEDHCRVIAHAWGTDPTPLVADTGGLGVFEFDVIIATDTLWNSSLHAPFIQTLHSTLKQVPTARVHLIAALHTGRYPIRSFLAMAGEAGFEVAELKELEVKGTRVRKWDADAEDSGSERRRWVVWIVLRWSS